MKIKSDTKTCPRCGGILINSDGEWAGEAEGMGGRIIISHSECEDCLSHFVLDNPIILSGM